MRLDTKVIIRLPADVRTALDRAAADDERTRSVYIRKLLTEHLRRRGYLKALPPRESRLGR